MLRVKEVAKRLAISASKVYRLVEGGLLSHYRIDGAIRISEEQIISFLNATKRDARSSNQTLLGRPRLRLRNLQI